MLKALAPVTTLLISWFAKFTEPSSSKLLNVLFIAFGVLLSSLGEVKFAWTGFLFQIIGTVAESSRLLLIQWLLRSGGATQPAPGAGDEEQQRQHQHDEAVGDSQQAESSASASSHREQGETYRDDQGSDFSIHKAKTGLHEAYPAQSADVQDEADASAVAAMSPLVLLYYYAPVCAALNLLTALTTEVPRFKKEDLDHVGIWMLVLNGAVAFCLNVSSVFLVSPHSLPHLSVSASPPSPIHSERQRPKDDMLTKGPCQQNNRSARPRP